VRLVYREVGAGFGKAVGNTGQAVRWPPTLHHAGFWSGSGPGDWSTDRSEPDLAILKPTNALWKAKFTNILLFVRLTRKAGYPPGRYAAVVSHLAQSPTNTQR